MAPDQVLRGERATRIELAFSAWEANLEPLRRSAVLGKGAGQSVFGVTVSGPKSPLVTTR